MIEHDLLMEHNFYPRPPRGGRPRVVKDQILEALISIHALREEGDIDHDIDRIAASGISIHALREEGDARHRTAQRFLWTFLSTPSARRAT